MSKSHRRLEGTKMIGRTVAVALLLVSLSWAADADRHKLSVHASAKEVHLQWFERKPVLVERKVPGGEFQALGIAEDGDFTDTAIDPRQIYTYQTTPIGETPLA